MKQTRHFFPSHLLGRGIALALLLLVGLTADAQFYYGSNMDFGKNRVQYENFEWKFYRFDKYETYFYTGGKELAEYTAEYAHHQIKKQEAFFDYVLDEKIQFVIYNKHSDFKQSNIGLSSDETYSIGGVTRIVGSKVFLYFEGDYERLNQQINSGIIEVLIYQMMYGGNWKDVIKNSALLTLPQWYVNGLISYLTKGDDPEVINRIKDGITNEKYDKFNRLNPKEATVASHAMWSYIADKYGPSTISNVLYMTRVTRDVEDGFIYVIGTGFDDLKDSWIKYYQNNYMNNGAPEYTKTSAQLDFKTRKNRTYQQLKVSSDGNKVAYSTNQRGQYKVFIYDRIADKRTRIFKDEHKLDRIVDYSYPVLKWHPTGKLLSFFREEKGQVLLCTYNLEEEQLYQKPIFNLEKILSFDYSPDGKQMVLSAVFNGQTDLYLYNIGGNTQKKITDDIFDDLQPSFVEGGNAIAFASNRITDSLNPTSIQFKDLDYKRDIFVIDYKSKEPRLVRVNSTANLTEKMPVNFNGSIAYLSIEDATYGRHIAKFDSAVSRIDTTIHYNYFYTKENSTTYNRNISEQSSSLSGSDYSEIVYNNDKYLLTVQDFNSNSRTEEEPKKIRKKQSSKSEETSDKDNHKERAITLISKPNLTPEGGEDFDVTNYEFENQKKTKRTVIPITTIDQDAPVKQEEKAFALTNQRNYNLNFKIDNSDIQLNNAFLNGQYQVFTGRPYNNPGLGATMRLGVVDLMEDYRVYGGFRYSGNSQEYLLGFQDLKKRLDKEYILSRIKTNSEIGNTPADIFTLQGTYSLIYPFSEVASLRGTITARNDRIVPLSVSANSLEIPIRNEAWGSFKTAYVFDNTRNIALNIKYGTRLKVFGEYYQKVFDQNNDNTDGNLYVVGFDIRNYQKISRQIIFVTRLAGSSSFGKDKLIYYMGGVDDWWKTSNNFDDTKIDETQNYRFQTIATNMRGHLQNIRNGNNFMVFNSELRFPVFSYFIRKPIQSEFIKNFQIIGFADAGTAWTGSSPFDDKNPSNTENIFQKPFEIDVFNLNDPIVGGYGFGLRTMLLGYFVRADWAWGIENGVVNDKSIFYLSLSMDI
ncbi:hypothetical protein GYB57_00335 [bacterium]|nr:hypothetical protein [bacterium]